MRAETDMFCGRLCEAERRCEVRLGFLPSDLASGDEVADAIGSFRAGERLGRSAGARASPGRTSGISGLADEKKVFVFGWRR